MPTIITEERYLSRSRDLGERYRELKQAHPKDVRFKKAGRTIRALRTLYTRDKVYAVKQLNYLEKDLVFFAEERRALLVQVIELLQKLILHKKLNKETGKKESPTDG